MALIRWSPRAAVDLENICEYVAKDSEHYAKVLAQGIMETVETLGDFPLSGRVVPEYNVRELRERIFQNFRIVYRLRSKDNTEIVEIVAICHGAMLLPKL
ncbi:MAG: toxin ParE1/3/4 [Bacillota bacterium]|nr:type II toxin-antitoxin system RelE/ParE family toxin [Bacillota bacterium]MDK2931106.1 toxin ParE1/3/4 [Bacillota bacterium]